MTKQTNRVNRGPIQHVRIRPAVGKMASRAAFGFDDGMFVLERAGHFGMALGANHVLLYGGTLMLLSETAVGFVTVRAKDQALNYLVAGYRRELRPLFVVTFKAELRLRGGKKMPVFM